MKKQVVVGLKFEVSAAQERRIISKAKALDGAEFYGDDDLRDAIHEMIDRLIFSDAELGDGAIYSVCTEQSTAKSKLVRT